MDGSMWEYSLPFFDVLWLGIVKFFFALIRALYQCEVKRGMSAGS